MPRFVRLSSFFGCFVTSLLCGAGFLLASFYLYLTPTLPNAKELKTTQLQTPLRIYSEDNKKIAEFGEKRRTPIDIHLAPTQLINAFIAAEDNRFFEHIGIDIKGLARATTQLISTGRIKSGGSTITMQVAKNFFLSRERTFIRKFNEIFLALQIEQNLSKNEILELYLNKIYLGNRAYGVQAAARVYYGKDIQSLNLAQMAMIAGLPKAPSKYNPIVNPTRATIRRDWILNRMKELELINSEEHSLAINSPITASYHGGTSELYAPYVAEMARQEIIKKYGSSAYTSGMRVYLTVDSELQRTASLAVKKGLESYDLRHGYRGPISSLVSEDLNDRELIFQLLRDTKVPRHHRAAYVNSIEAGGEVAELTLVDGRSIQLSIDNASWARPLETINRRGSKPTKLSDIFKPGDIIEVAPLETETQPLDVDPTKGTLWKLVQTPEVQGALVSIEPKNGKIKALVGGYDFTMSHYNRAVQAKRQAGSNFKAFVYLAALENGATASTLINDSPIVFEDNNLETAWRPENSSGKFYGPTRIRQALYNSRNLVSIRLLNKTGIRNTLKTVEKFGFKKNELPRDLSLALGSAAVTPMKIAAGYSMIANGGHHITPHLIDYIEDNEGNVILQTSYPEVCLYCTDTNQQKPNSSEDTKPIPANRIADERSIFILHSMLKDVIKKGTGRRALKLKRTDLAGKTGTTNDQVDAWFSGFNTEIETSVWVGFDNPTSLGRREYGAKAALPIWNDYMSVALKDMPPSHMAQPDGLVTVRIDKTTGQLAKPGTQNAMFETYREELAPTKSISARPTNPRKVIPEKSISPEDIF